MVAHYQFAITIGILVAYFTNAQILSFGQNLDPSSESFITWIFNAEVWRSMFGSEAIPGVIYLSLLFIVPESPRWLMAQNREINARKVLKRLLENDAAEKEILEIKEVLKTETGNWRQLFAPGIRVALIIGIVLAVLSQFSGINAIIYFGPKIFEAAGFGIDGSLSGQVLIGIVNVLFILVAIWKIDSFGRRGLLFIRSIGMMIAHICIGFIYFNTQYIGNLFISFY